MEGRLIGIITHLLLLLVLGKTEGNHRIHRLRHARELKSSSIYHHSTSDSLESKRRHKAHNNPEYFSLNCPHVADASNEDVKIEVTWTKDATIWVKVDNGEKRIHNKLTTFKRKVVNGKTVLRMALNDNRYLFNYDELTGDFSMEIRPINVQEDAGVWQCHVTVTNKDDMHTLTSRSRIKPPHQSRKPVTTHKGQGHPHRQRHPHLHQEYTDKGDETFGTPSPSIPHIILPPPPTQSTHFNVFNRKETGVVQISRDSRTQVSQTVVFDRKDGERRMHVDSVHTAIDYEMSMNDEPVSQARGSRARSAPYAGYRSTTSLMNPSLSMLIIITLTRIILH